MDIPRQLISKRQMLELVNLSYPTIWRMAREGRFPRGRVVGGKVFWFADEIAEWQEHLEPQRLKGDDNG